MAAPQPYKGGWHPTNDYLLGFGQARAQAIVQARLDSGKYNLYNEGMAGSE